MEIPRIKERAYSYASYLEKPKNHFDSSPEMRPMDASDMPPPISLSPSALESSNVIRDLMLEKDQDNYLISVLKKHCFLQSKEIEKLKNKLDHMQRDYENLVRTNKTPRKQSIIETALLVRGRSQSINESV